MKEDYNKLALLKHTELKGKLRISAADTLDTAYNRSIYYSPGVGAVSQAIADGDVHTRDVTGTNNTVLVISDGSAVLGLGNIGAEASLPVMEGKCMLFSELAGINAFPIVLDTQDPDEIVNIVVKILPSVGAVNLEDIAAPACFEVEQRLKELSAKPIFHDDQHGTAIVVLAGLMNAAKVVGKDIKELKAVISGAGAAGHAIAKLLSEYGLSNLLVLDSKGIISRSTSGLRPDKQALADTTNPSGLTGDLTDAIAGADVFVGVSQPDILSAEHVQSMAKDPVIFALSNPNPEITPELALEAGAAVVATGRSDYPNQVNNALVFPALFRGALDNQVAQITEEHKLAAAEALAGMVDNPTKDMIIPSLDKADEILKAISAVVT